MRDPDRIDRILGLISELWHQMPDTRLGQLLYNFADFGGDIFYKEDYLTEKKLKDALANDNIKAYDEHGNRIR